MRMDKHPLGTSRRCISVLRFQGGVSQHQYSFIQTNWRRSFQQNKNSNGIFARARTHSHPRARAPERRPEVKYQQKSNMWGSPNLTHTITCCWGASKNQNEKTKQKKDKTKHKNRNQRKNQSKQHEKPKKRKKTRAATASPGLR